MEDNISPGGGDGDGFRMTQVHSIQAHLLLCGPVPDRPRPVPVHRSTDSVGTLALAYSVLINQGTCECKSLHMSARGDIPALLL